MFRQAMTLAVGSVLTYAWLSASLPPLLRAIGSFTTHPRDSRAWHALGLAIAATFMWTMITAGAGMLVLLLAPQAVLAFQTSGVIEASVFAGALVWAMQPIATHRVAGFGERVELAAAQALGALLADESAVDLYRAFGISPHPPRARSVGVYDLAS